MGNACSKPKHRACAKRTARLLASFSITATAALAPTFACAQNAAAPQVHEVNVTNDLAISSGEPEIAVDPTNYRNLAIVEFGVGSDQMPASTFSPAALLEPPPAAMSNTGRVMVSHDGGDRWQQQGPAPAYDPAFKPHRGGGDPFIAWGPDGTLYVGDEAGPDPEPAPGKSLIEVYGQLLPRANLFIAASTDAGRSFSAPQSAGTPIDRPWMSVDRTNGTLYTVSSGTYSAARKLHNAPGPDAPNDRWLVAWKPRLAGKSEPRRLGGPDFSAAGGSTITAANGVIAATFVLGGPPPGGGTGGNAPARPVPASLVSIMKDGVTSCSLQAPCLFFETSTDEGQHWTRHHVPVPGGIASRQTLVSADAGRPGRYAISVLDPTATHFSVLVTEDSGETWAPPAAIPEVASGANFKFWMAYGPTGVLGMVWKKQRDDLTPPLAPPSGSETMPPAIGPAFDVYSSISCDGGAHWFQPIRVNSAVSPAGPSASDDFTYLTMDDRNVHMVWGDHRALPQVRNVPGAAGGTQAYYGRVPFAMFTGGSTCGRP